MTYFTIGKNNIKYLGDNFKEWFDGMDDTPVERKLYSVTLPEPMNDEEIKKAYNPSEVSFGEIVGWMKENNDGWNIFYVKDAKDVLRAVDVDWFGSGWGAGASEVGDPHPWNGGRRVFSRNPLEPLTLNPTWKLCKSCAEEMKKHL